MFLTVLPKHLIVFILDEWLFSWNDFSSLDLAMANKELRQYIYAPNSQDSTIGKINYDIAITIRNGEHFVSLMKWKEKRLLEITKLCLDYLHVFEYCMLGKRMSALTELKISHSHITELQSIFYGNLPNLIKLTMEDCSINICREALNVTDKVFSVTNIKELLLENINCTMQSDESKMISELNNVSLADCTKLYLWMAKCCSQLTKLHLNDCYGTHYTNTIPMLHALPALKVFSYWASLEFSRQLEYNSPESEATFQDIAPLSVEGINEEKQNYLPHIKSLDIYLVGMSEDSWLVGQAFEVMFQGCDLRELQILTLGLSYDTPTDYYDLLLQFILLHGHHLKSICLETVDENISPLLTAICKYCTSLEHWELMDLTIEDSLFTSLSLPNTLSHLSSLSFDAVFMSNASMEMICRSSVASQLTKLSLINVNSLSLQVHHLIAHSFPRLQYLEIEMSFYSYWSNDSQRRDRIRNIVQWLDELFSSQCAFATTIETLSLIIFDELHYCLDWTTTENASFANELFHDHMLKHWHFPFPALQSFAMTWRINHPHMNDIMVGSLLNCPKLHSIELDLLKNESRNRHRVMNIKNRPEVIRQMRKESNY